MGTLTSYEFITFFLSLAVLLGTARGLGELALKYRQPVIVGEILAGIVLGPTTFGYLMPELSGWLFPSHGGTSTILEGLATLSATLLLFVAGLEVELPLVWQQGRGVLLTSSVGFLFPFGVGFASAWWLPTSLGQADTGVNQPLFAVFFGTALTISALPVIAKILLDLNLYKSRIGMMIMSAAMLDDLVGWIVFSVILGISGVVSFSGVSVGLMVSLTVGFTVGMLTIGRCGMNLLVPLVRERLTGPGGGVGFALVLALASAAATEAIGVHAILGAFLAGIAIGDTKHFDQQTRDIIKQFVFSFFAPIYFASIGLRIDFAAHFDLVLILIVLALGCFGKIVGSGLGAFLSGMSKREALTVGFGMNARGMMQIIFGTMAFQYGLIGENLLVAFVIMAVTTSVLSGPVMERLMDRRQRPPIRSNFIEP